VGQFRVNETRLDEIIKLIGTNFEAIEGDILPVEISYRDRGLSFYYQSNDSSKTIYCIIVTPSFDGETIEGINTAKATMGDVIVTYGEPNGRLARRVIAGQPGIEDLNLRLKEIDHCQRFPWTKRPSLAGESRKHISIRMFSSILEATEGKGIVLSNVCRTIFQKFSSCVVHPSPVTPK